MNHTLVVQILKRSCGLEPRHQCLARRQAMAGGEHGRQAATMAQLDNEIRAVFEAPVEHVDEVGVREFGGVLSPKPKAFDEEFVVSKLRVRELESDLAIECVVMREEDHGGTAGPNWSDELPAPIGATSSYRSSSTRPTIPVICASIAPERT